MSGLIRHALASSALTAAWHGCIHYGWLSASFRSIEWESAEASVAVQHAQVAVHYLSCWLSKTNSSVLQTAVCVTCGALTAGPCQPICVRVANPLELPAQRCYILCLLTEEFRNSLFSRHCRYSESKLNYIAAIVRQASCSNISEVCPHFLRICISNFHEKQASKKFSSDNKVFAFIKEI